MKRSKSAGLAAFAILAMAAFLVPSSASATRLCKVEVAPCPAGERWEEKTEIEAKLESGKKAIFEAGKFNEKGEFELIYKIECNESVATGKTTTAGGGAGVSVLGDVTDLTFANSKGNCPVSKELGTCSITALGKPWAGSIAWFAGYSGTLSIVEKGGAGPPRLQFGCLGGTVTCIYGKNVVSVFTKGGNPWLALPSQVQFEKLTGSSMLCPAVAFWSGEYEGVKPAAMWLTNE